MNFGSVRDYDEFIRRLIVTAVLLLVYRFGAQLPLPGVAPNALAQIRGITPAHLSIFALGIMPFFGIIIFVEILKVVAPRLRKWELAEQRNHAWLTRLIVILSLVAAAAQASGLVLAMENIPGLVDAPGTPFRLTGILTLVAGTALVMWLVDLITRYGLGSGMWIVLAGTWLGDLPGTVGRAFARSPLALIAVETVIGLSLLAAMLAALIAVIRAGSDGAATTRTLLWTHLIAGTTWPWLILLFGALIGMDPYWLSPANPLALLALAVLLFVFAYLYARSCRLAGADTSDLPPSLLGGVLSVIAFVTWLAPLGYIAPIAGHLVLLTVVAVTILDRWWNPPFATAPSETTTPGA